VTRLIVPHGKLVAPVRRAVAVVPHLRKPGAGLSGQSCVESLRKC
jgi:hypothetical protein